MGKINFNWWWFVFVTVIGCFTVACNSEEENFGVYGYFLWEIRAGEMTIIDYNGPGGDVTIPSQINGKPVTVIGEFVFNFNQLTQVTIPDSITYIQQGAFAHNQLLHLIIPDSVTTIGMSAFLANGLVQVIIPDSVITIGGSAFALNNLTEITIPHSVTSIGQRAFEQNQLIEISIGKNVYFTNVYDLMPFNNGFEAVYSNNGRQAGTYTRVNTTCTVWTRHE